MIKKILIKILFKLLYNEETFENIDSSLIDNWLSSQYGHAGFIEYFRKRDLEIMKSMLSLPTDEDYWMLVGKRKELLKLSHQMKIKHQEKKLRDERFRKQQEKKDKKS